MAEKPKPAWVKSLVQTFSAVIFLVGLGGMTDDLSTWYHWLEQGVPWRVLIASSLLLMILLWWPELSTVVGRVLGRTPDSKVSISYDEDAFGRAADALFEANQEEEAKVRKELVELRQENQQFKTEIAKLRSRNDEKDKRIKGLQDDFKALVETNDDLGSQIHEYTDMLRRARHEIEYGRKPRQFDPLAEVDFKLMVAEIDKLTETLYLAVDRGVYIMQSRVGQMLPPGEDDTRRNLYSFVSERVVVPTARARTLLCEVLEYGKDPRDPLIFVSDRYTSLRRWIRMTPKVFGVELETSDNVYAEWNEADSQFLAEYGKALRVKHLSSVRQELVYSGISKRLFGDN